MPTESETKSKSKHRKSTCAGCRRRKSKCDGKTPKCTTCIAYKDECHYDKPPSLAYVRSLEEEVQDLKAELRQVKTQAWMNRRGSTDDKNVPGASPASDAAGSQQSGSSSLPFRPRQVKWEGDISVDDHGSVSFHNSTSAVHEPASGSSSMNPFSHLSGSGASQQLEEDEQTKQNLVLNATHQRQIEPLAIANSADKVNIPREISLELLKYHWCWQHPLFLFVYRPAFTRGMSLVDYSSPGARDPPYFSETLLKVIVAHSARFLNHDVYQHQYQSVMNVGSPMSTKLTAPEFMQKISEEARMNLGMDMLKSSSIPTIQALLQQSAREIVFGRSSQAWTFAGVAFRMALDMGIHLPTDKLQTFVRSLSPEDVEIRKRLFWSCYTWDKILSLYLGRMPGFTHPATEEIPMTFMDDYSDADLWTPYYGENPKPDHAHAPNYPPCPGYVVSTFRQLCSLCIILNDMMQHIYSPEASARQENNEDESSPDARVANEEPYIRISRNLREWLVSLPSHLRINPDHMPPLAPPVHIMSLNLLYHTTLILLHRPVLLGARDLSQPGPQRSYQTCLSATAAIHDLLMLQANTFGLSHVSYLNAYSAYTASTIAVLRFEHEYRPDEDLTSISKRTGIHFLLEVLQRTANAMPALERSNAIIRKRIKAVIDRQTEFYRQQQAQQQQSQPQPDPSSYLSASQPTPTGFQMPTTRQLDLAQPTAFQTISNPINLQQQQQEPQQQHGNYPTSLPENESNQLGLMPPFQWQNDMRNDFYADPSMAMDNFLPAFPNQQFPVGSEHSFGSQEVDTQARAALLGYSLDPHPRFNAPGNIDWNFTDMYDGNPIPM